MDYMLKTWWREIVMVPVALTIHRGGILRSSGFAKHLFVIAVFRVKQDVKREIRAELLLAIDDISTVSCR